ncbi:hypothetical protein D3C71_1327430 [compost metagenome]
MNALDLIERLEKNTGMSIGNTNSGIGDLPVEHRFAIASLFIRQQDPYPACIGELDRVAQEIIEHLLDPQFIAESLAGNSNIYDRIEMQTLRIGIGCVGAHNLFGQLDRIELGLLQ